MENVTTYRSEVGSKIKTAAASPDSSRLHIIAKNDQWAVKKEGASKAVKLFKAKEDAIEGATIIVRKGGAKSIFIHKKDGTVESVR